MFFHTKNIFELKSDDIEGFDYFILLIYNSFINPILISLVIPVSVFIGMLNFNRIRKKGVL